MFFSLILGLACAPAPAVSDVPVAPVVEIAVAAPERSETFSATLARLDAELGGLERRLETRAGDAFLLNLQAGVLMQRARLTGRYDDYARAEAAVDSAFDASPEGAGPFLTRASLNYTLHRLDRVEADLARAESAVIVGDDTRAAILGRRAGLWLQRGLAGGAEAFYRQALDLHSTPGLLSALAIAQSRQGHWDDAEVSLDAAAAT
jgi:tetratricopeptide (TPR) repeat protein